MDKDVVMETLVKKRLINTSEYNMMGEKGMLRPDENVELINGEIFTMAPIGSKHADVVRQLSIFLIRTIIDEAIVSSQNPVLIDQWNEPEPDIALLKFKKAGYSKSHPESSDILMIIEVSDTTYKFDRHVKLPIYATSGIPIFWIINLNKNCIEVYEEPVEDRYQKRTRFNPGDQIPIQGRSFDVAEILLTN